MRASDNIFVWKLVYYILNSDNGIPTLLMLIVSVNLFKFSTYTKGPKRKKEEIKITWSGITKLKGKKKYGYY